MRHRPGQRKLFFGKANLRARAVKQASYSPSPEQPPIIIHVANPTAFDRQGSIIMLELADEDCAKRVALRIARETGRCVTVRNANMTVIQTIPAAKTH